MDVGAGLLEVEVGRDLSVVQGERDFDGCCYA